jgi:hypothetical protein
MAASCAARSNACFAKNAGGHYRRIACRLVNDAGASAGGPQSIDKPAQRAILRLRKWRNRCRSKAT